MEQDSDRSYRLSVPITDDERLSSRVDSQDGLLNPTRSYDSGNIRRDSGSLPPEPVDHAENGIPPPQAPEEDVFHYSRPGFVRRKPVGGASAQRFHEANAPIPQPSSDYGPAGNVPPENVREPNASPEKSRSGYAPVERVPDFWRPLWLRKLVLASFAVLFAGLLAALLVLRYYAKDDNGFGVAKSTSHYTWTYAPTAVLIILIVLWRQVDYHCKSIAPWAELRKGPTTASKSVLLDYTSTFHVLAFLKAIRHGHWTVIASILGVGLLNLMAIFSTGLFVLHPTNVTDSTFAFVTTTKFDSSLFDSSSLSGAPVYAYYGLISQGLSPEPGVTTDFAYSTFKAADTPTSNAIFAADVDALFPQSNCVALDVQLNGPSTIRGSDSSGTFGDLSLKLPAGTICQQWPTISVPAEDPDHFILPSVQLTGTMQRVSCVSNMAGGTNTSSGPDTYLYTLTDIRYQQKLFANASEFQGGTFAIASNTSRTVSKIVNIACQPSYAVGKLYVTNNTSVQSSTVTNPSFNAVGSAKNTTLSGLTSQDLMTAFESGLTSAEALFGTTSGLVSTAEQVPNTLFSLMALTQGSSSYEVLLDNNRMLSATDATYKGIVSQYAKRSLTSPGDDRITGTAIHLVSRLQMQAISLWLMVGGFAMLILLTIAIIFTGTMPVVSRDPNSIGTMAAILTRSNDLQWTLRGHSASSPSRIRAALSGFVLHSAVIPSENGNASFKIVMEGSHASDTVQEDMPREIKKYWRPVTLNITFLILTFVLPIGGIVALELLQQRSENHSGILDLPNTKASAAYIHFIPALITLLLASLYNILDFNTSLFSPYSILKSGNACASRTLTPSLLGKISPWSLVVAIKTRHLGAASAIIAAMLASIATVFVSGLYSVHTYTLPGSTANATQSLTRIDTFNPIWQDSFSNDSGAAALLSIFEHNPAQSYPDFVFGPYAFPKFQLGAIEPPLSSAEAINSTTPATAILPALGATLDCTVLGKSSVKVSTLAQSSNLSAFNTDVAFVSATAQLPESCQLGGTSGTDGFVTFQNTFPLLAGGEQTYGGEVLDLLFGQNASIFGNYGEGHGQYIGDNPGVGCPSLAVTFGSFKLGSDANDDVTTMICWQGLVEVNINTSFADARSGRVSSAEGFGSRFAVQNPGAESEAGKETFDFRIQNNLNTEMDGFAAADGQGGALDKFFQTLIYGTDGVGKPQVLLGPGKQDALLDNVQGLYARYMALVLNGVMRRGCVDGQSCQAIASTTASKRQDTGRNLGPLQVPTTRSRLVQNESCKYVMQVLLGLMILFGAIALLLTKTWRVVPTNICTIAGTMTVLAGSELCNSADLMVCECCGRPRRREDADVDREGQAQIQGQVIIPEGAEWMSDARLQSVLDGGGRRFEGDLAYSLGWWREKPEQGRQRRFGIDTGIRADGADDQDWIIGKRGGVEGKGLGWGDFMKRNLSWNNLGIGTKRASALSVEGEEMYMRGGLGVHHGEHEHEHEYEHEHEEEVRQQVPVERFRSLRGYGGGAGRGQYAYARDMPEDEADMGLLKPTKDDAGGGGRRVRWKEEDDIFNYVRRSEDGGDAASSLYSGDGYARERERQGEFNFDFGGGEA